MFITMIVIMFILFLSLISIVFDLTGIFFVFELLLLLLFLLFGIIFAAGTLYEWEWIWPGLLIFFGANLINLSGLYLKTNNFIQIILPITVGVAGFLIAMIRKRSVDEESEDMENEDIKTETEEKKEEPEEDEDVIRTNFSPGKYIASETGKKYHIPKCDWAKKINKKRIVWFDDKKEARKKGYLPCKCIK